MICFQGYCIPPEYEDDESSGDGQGSGLGLGEGQGEKDVSDRIESEDQLEDARPQGMEKEKEPETDCKVRLFCVQRAPKMEMADIIF